MTDTAVPRSYEFFISRAGADADVAKEVADVLRRAGHSVQYQDEDIPVGANFIARMSELVEDCAHLIVIMSPAYLDSPYCREEWTNFLQGVFASDGARRVIVILARDCKPPGILRARVFASLIGKVSETDRADTILSAAEGRAARIKIDPPILQIPFPRNPDFCGREDAIAKLEAALPVGGRDVAAVAIVGGGGLGKSSVAAEYAYRHKGDYAGIWWLSAQSRITLLQSLARLATAIDPKLAALAKPVLDRDIEPIARTGLDRLKGGVLPWLLIYDNAEGPDAMADIIPSRNAHVLITTRWPDWHGFAAELNLDLFTPDVARDYLMRRAGSTDRAGAARLAAALDCLPLALDQAGAFCRRSGASFDDYRSRLADFIRSKPGGARYPNSVFATFSTAIDNAIAHCPSAERLMSLLAFLGPDRIAVSWFGPDIIDLVQRSAALEALSAVSLLSFEDGRIRVHRLVQEVMRRRVLENGVFDAIRPALHALLKAAFSQARAVEEPLVVQVLDVLQCDPQPNASLEVEFTHNDFIDVEVHFAKSAEGIDEVIRALDGGRPFHRIEKQFYLDGGWKERLISNRTF